MGHRAVKRVPMDFDWPVGEVWEGYLRPDYRPCPSDDCYYGSKLAAAWLEKIASLILMLGEYHADGRHPGHPYFGGIPFAPDQLPKANAVELTAGLAGRPPMFGHDAIDRWAATRAIIKAAGLPDDWGTCPVCHGHAIHPDDYEASEAWTPTEPPVGEGWQLWETTSEGSPVSPVFASARELANWCEPNATMFASMGMTADEWLASFERGTTDVDSLLVVRVDADAA